MQKFIDFVLIFESIKSSMTIYSFPFLTWNYISAQDNFSAVFIYCLMNFKNCKLLTLKFWSLVLAVDIEYTKMIHCRVSGYHTGDDLANNIISIPVLPFVKEQIFSWESLLQILNIVERLLWKEWILLFWSWSRDYSLTEWSLDPLWKN